MKIRPVGTVLFHADGPTDRQTDMVKLIAASRNFENALKYVSLFLISPRLYSNCFKSLFKPKHPYFSVYTLLFTGTNRVRVTAFCVTVYPGCTLIPSDLRFQYSATDQTSVYIKSALWDIHLISCGRIDIHGGAGAIMRN
jgi:hypothetical protein